MNSSPAPYSPSPTLDVPPDLPHSSSDWFAASASRTESAGTRHDEESAGSHTELADNPADADVVSDRLAQRPARGPVSVRRTGAPSRAMAVERDRRASPPETGEAPLGERGLST